MIDKPRPRASLRLSVLRASKPSVLKPRSQTTPVTTAHPTRYRIGAEYISPPRLQRSFFPRGSFSVLP